MTGIVVTNGGTALARVQRHGDRKPSLLACEFAAQDTADSDRYATLREHKLDKSPCSTLLPVGDYQLLVLDAPEVPDEEMRAAIRWQIQGMIDFHVDDAVLDIFDAPADSAARNKQLYVVVARSETVRQRIIDLEQAGARLEVIDIPELAMRNIAACLPEDKAGLASLYFSENQCLITITHNATLYLTRSVDIGYRQMQEQASNPQALCNRLALEIQRSMDFYEHNYRQAAIRTVAMLPAPVTLYGLTDALQQSLGLEVRIVNVDDIMDCVALPDDAHAADCLLAIGSALRTDAVTL